MKNNSTLKIYKILLVTLITSLSITGVSYLDDKIWNIILLVIGMSTYSIVGVLFSFGLLHGKNAGKDAYVAIFVLLLLLGYGVYCGIVNLQKWILGWALWVKILIPSLLVAAIIATIVLMVKSNKTDNIVYGPNVMEEKTDEDNK